MGAVLQSLRDLQDLELQIFDIRSQIGRFERRVAAQQRKIDRLKAELREEHDALQREQSRFDSLDLDLKSRNTNITKLRELLNSVRTNKEYAQYLSQMNNEKADAAKVETQALEIMQSLEQRKATYAQREQGMDVEYEKLREAEESLAQSQQSLSGRLNKLEAQRDEALQHIDPGMADSFRKLSERYDGEPLAEVLQPNPRAHDYLCGGCHMGLTAEVANALRVRDDVITCKNCGKILYLDR